MSLTLRSLTATAVVVPMARPLWTSVQAMREAPLLLVDLHTEEGVVGHAYLFCYLRAAAGAIAAFVEDLGTRLRGRPVVPASLRKAVADYSRLIGQRGVVSMAGAALDMAAWDALAKAADLPLVRLLGAEPRPLRAYNSNGLGLVEPQAAADEAQELLAGGFEGVKMRLGRPSAEADLAAVRAVRKALPDEVALMVDFNQALSPREAQSRGAMLDGEGVFWIEEPLRHDDYVGYARLRQTVSTPLQFGENFAGPKAMAAALAAGCVDYVMPDAERIGGVSGWMDAAALAAAHEIEMSSHLFPEVTAHLLAATPTAHWLEYVDWAEPLLQAPLRIRDGLAVPSEAAGSGLAWDSDAVERFRIDA
ncbi:enolase C-terminal domain-like protein [Variovorax sp. RA8]|uniref:enolase C-terminal domain-like protein n=1 Tax=Variovorax sp. (strain JCM 16519 / RA8) TaxID=662548 RepID=UPI001316C14A|nr:enolase C-terminal domain-like protein [Variovorax sp. RA8]VTU16617.1 Mandelate racemase [Variovorax sp. RA8]